MDDDDEINLAIVDWELCRYGMIAVDLASMIASLYIQWQFEGTPSAQVMLRGFISGYGWLGEETAFQTAGLIAIYLMMYEKLDLIMGEKTEARVREIHQHAKEFLISAAQKDVKWLSQSCLGMFFKDE